MAALPACSGASREARVTRGSNRLGSLAARPPARRDHQRLVLAALPYRQVRRRVTDVLESRRRRISPRGSSAFRLSLEVYICSSVPMASSMSVDVARRLHPPWLWSDAVIEQHDGTTIAARARRISAQHLLAVREGARDRHSAVLGDVALESLGRPLEKGGEQRRRASPWRRLQQPRGSPSTVVSVATSVPSRSTQSGPFVAVELGLVMGVVLNGCHPQRLFGAPPPDARVFSLSSVQHRVLDFSTTASGARSRKLGIR